MAENKAVYIEEKKVLYTKLVDKFMNSQRAYTHDLTTGGARFRETGGVDRIKYLVPEGGGLFDYDARDPESNKGRPGTGRWVEAKIEHDRYFKFIVDELEPGKIDDDLVESLLEQELNRATIEQDMVRISAIAEGAKEVDEGNVTKTNIREKVMEGIAYAKENAGIQLNAPGTGLIMYISHTAYNLLTMDKSVVFQRLVTSSDGKEKYYIEEIDGVKIVPVPDSIMKTKFDKEDGNGALIPADDSKDINFIVLPKNAVAVPTLTDNVMIFPPGNSSANARFWVVDGRFAYGAFTVEVRDEAIFASVAGGTTKSTK